MNDTPGLSSMQAVERGLHAALEHVPPTTRAILTECLTPHLQAVYAVLAPPSDKNQDHG